MKMLRYQVMGYTIIYDPETEQDIKHEAPATIEKPWSEQAEASARQVALGDVTIYDDGEEVTPTIENRVSTLEESNVEMAEVLDMILSGVTSDE